MIGIEGIRKSSFPSDPLFDFVAEDLVIFTTTLISSVFVSVSDLASVAGKQRWETGSGASFEKNAQPKASPELCSHLPTSPCAPLKSKERRMGTSQSVASVSANRWTARAYDTSVLTKFAKEEDNSNAQRLKFL